jgi:hypothetical protein
MDNYFIKKVPKVIASFIPLSNRNRKEEMNGSLLTNQLTFAPWLIYSTITMESETQVRSYGIYLRRFPDPDLQRSVII